ncbi:hypothetical protein [Hymenobacter coalescens]
MTTTTCLLDEEQHRLNLADFRLLLDRSLHSILSRQLPATSRQVQTHHEMIRLYQGYHRLLQQAVMITDKDALLRSQNKVLRIQNEMLSHSLQSRSLNQPFTGKIGDSFEHIVDNLLAEIQSLRKL